MSNEIATLVNEIQENCNELNSIISTISKLPPVTHLSKSRIRFIGGVIGNIQNLREEDRLEKLMNQPIYNDLSFSDLVDYILEITDKTCEAQSKLQNLIGKDDDRYYGLVVYIYRCVNNCILAWYNYSPDMALETIYIEDEIEGELYEILKINTQISISKMDIPDEIKKLMSNRTEIDSSDGCFGVFILMIISSSILIGGISYCASQFV